MFQTIFAGLLIALIIVPLPLLLIANQRQKRKALHMLLQQFSIAGSSNGLSFSSQEVLRNSVIGFDGIQRKLLVVERSADERFHPQLIDLKELRNCRVEKQYRTFSRNDTRPPERVLEKVALVFETPQPATPVVFYQYTTNSIHEAPELERKANDWQVMLMKLHTPQAKQPART